MSKFDGDNISLEIWGESHSADIGIKIKGVKFDGEISEIELQDFMNRRRAKKQAYSTTRLEEDKVIFVEGLQNGKIIGEIIAKINNEKMRSNDYDKFKNIPRPSHADYVGKIKYGANYDFTGGGHFSGRMTAPICIAGGIAKQILKTYGIFVNAYIQNIGGIDAKSYKNTDISKVNFNEIDKDFPLINNESRIDMQQKITIAKANLDSIGGVIECVAVGIPIALGDYMFESLEGKISKLMFGIPAIKGIEFGDGFDFKNENASKVNDEMRIEDGKVKHTTNHNGGILGGISTGEPLTLAVVVKPTPSIAKKQNSVDLLSMQNVELEIVGRHDACIVPRAVPVVESVVMIAILDEILK